MRIRLVFCLLGAAVFPGTLLAASPFDGTWKQDAASGTFSKKPMKMLLKGGMFDCMTCTPPYRVKADGTDQPVSGHPGVDAVAVKIVDENTVSEIEKRAGKVVSDETITVGDGGKSAVVKWIDSSSTAPVTGTTNLVLASPGPAGSHPASGSWTVGSVANVSETGLLMTFKVADGAVSFSTPAGLSYTAKLDGTPAPFMGEPAISTVSLKKISTHEIQETDMHEGKPSSVVTMTVAADGRTMAIQYVNKRSGRTASFTAMKQ